MSNRAEADPRAGFAFARGLLTLAITILVLGIVVPAVIDQLETGEPTRIGQDLESIRAATRLFRLDVKRSPGTPEQLVLDPADWADSTDSSGAAIPASLLDAWSGPYLELGSLLEGGDGPDTMQIAFGIRADPSFSTATWEGTRWLTLGFRGVPARRARQVSEVMDGNVIITNNDAAGRVRWDAVGERLLYFVLPAD